MEIKGYQNYLTAIFSLKIRSLSHFLTRYCITYQQFYQLFESVEYFKSLIGKDYHVQSIKADVMRFIRISTAKEKEWSMDLKRVHQAYFELTDFQTANFKPYVPPTHSATLGLLLYVSLLK